MRLGRVAHRALSAVTCMAALSKPAAASASTYARPSTCCGLAQTPATTAENRGRFSSAVPAGTSVGSEAWVDDGEDDGVWAAAAVEDGVGVTGPVASGAEHPVSASASPSPTQKWRAATGRVRRRSGWRDTVRV